MISHCVQSKDDEASEPAVVEVSAVPRGSGYLLTSFFCNFIDAGAYISAVLANEVPLKLQQLPLCSSQGWHARLRADHKRHAET